MSGTWIPTLIAALVATVSTPPILKVLRRYNIIDVATSRSSHSGTAVRGLGIATLCGVIAGLLVAFYLTEPGSRGLLLLVLAMAFFGAVLGATEDFHGLSVGIRAVLQSLMAVAASIAILFETGAPWFFGIPAAVYIAGYINAANFVDGLDGMSGIHGLVCGIFYLYLGYLIELSWLMMAGGVIAASFAAFLPWNLGRKGTFLGDSGSYLLGALVATVAVATWLSGAEIIVAFAPTIIYCLDAGGTLLRRLKEGEKWYEAHRDFVYQRISIAGLSHLSASSIVGLFSVSVSGLILWFSYGSLPVSFVGYLLVALLCVLYWFMPSVILRLRKGRLRNKSEAVSTEAI